MVDKLLASIPDSWIVTIAHNNLDLTIRAIESFRAQEGVGNVGIIVVNNESRDGTREWLEFANYRYGVVSVHNYPQKGVAHAWNLALRWLFERQGAERVLVCNNDVQLRPDTYQMLDAEKAPFVTAVGYHSETALAAEIAPAQRNRRPHPDFSCYLIRRNCWDTVGPFDEGFKGAFCEDWDYHVRMHAAGIEAYSIDLPFWHVGGGSQSVKRADDQRAIQIQMQAGLNRQRFADKYGFEGGSPEYYNYFQTPAREIADPPDY